jgi:hypothetical protein
MLLDGLTKDVAKTTEEPLVASSSSETMQDYTDYAAKQRIINHVDSCFEKAKTAKNVIEQKALKSLDQWRGKHSAEEQVAISRAKSRNPYAADVFIKVTKTKATAAIGQILDLVFDNDRIPITVSPTQVPEGGVEDVIHLMAEEGLAPSPYGFPGDGMEVPKGADTRSMLGGLADKIEKFIQGKKAVKGPSPDPTTSVQLTPADEAAYRMQKFIIDQLEEGHFQRECRRAIWQCVVLGTGIMKGPVTYSQVNHRWEKNKISGINEYIPEVIKKPKSNYVSFWDFYPDPVATRIDDAKFVIERHRMNSEALAALKRYEAFDSDAIDYLLSKGPSPIENQYWEDQIRDVQSIGSEPRYDVREFWGVLSKELLEPMKEIMGDSIAKGADQYQVNIWKCDDQILRLIINPYIPERIPYYAVPFEEHPEQIWGISLPENMEDAQILMNNHIRMMEDNLALAGNAIFEINETYLGENQDAEIYAGKVFKTNGPPGHALNAININNTSQSHIIAFDKARQIADEVTGQPSYAHGGASTTGATRTASGMSMLMSAAAGNIRQVTKNIDEYLLKPTGEAYFNWNMMHNDEAEIKGDVRITAGGTAALVKREVMSQRLLQYMQIAGGVQPLALQTNWNYINKEFARSLGLDSDKAQADPSTVALNTEMMAKMQQKQNPQEPGAAPADQTGGGSMAPGTPQQPGEQQFTGNAGASPQ